MKGLFWVITFAIVNSKFCEDGYYLKKVKSLGHSAELITDDLDYISKKALVV